MGIIAVHNISSNKLRFAGKLGGLPCPSIAYVNSDHSFDKFGDITLMCSPELSNPANKDLLACDSDIYSPRFPPIENVLNIKLLKELLTRGQEISNKFSQSSSLAVRVEDILSSAPINELSMSLYNCPELFLIFKEEVMGEEFNPSDWPEEQVRYSSMASDSKEVRDWIDNYMSNRKTPYIDRSDESLNELEGIILDHIDKTAHDIEAALEEKGSSAIKRGRDYEYFKSQFIKDLFSKSEDGTLKFNLQAISDLEKDKKIWSRNSNLLERNNLRSEMISIDPKLKTRFESWAEEKFGPVIKKSYFRHLTRSGNLVKKPLNLEELTKSMKQNLRGGENFNYGSGNIRAKVAKKFNTWRSIEREEGRLTEDSNFQNLKEETNNKLLELIDKLRPFYKFSQTNQFIQTDDMVEIISEYAGGRFQALREGFELTEDFPKNDIDTFINELKTMDTHYFEGKFKRSVAINEFSAAVIPKDIESNSPEIISLLKDSGVDVVTFDPDIDGDRENKISQMGKKHKLIRHGKHDISLTP